MCRETFPLNEFLNLPLEFTITEQHEVYADDVGFSRKRLGFEPADDLLQILPQGRNLSRETLRFGLRIRGRQRRMGADGHPYDP